MPYYTLTELRTVMKDANGNTTSTADGYVANQTRTDVGSFTACNGDTNYVLFSTDTDVRINGFHPNDNTLVPAGAMVTFPAKGRTFTLTAKP
jgi:hypothetical protein